MNSRDLLKSSVPRALDGGVRGPVRARILVAGSLTLLVGAAPSPSRHGTGAPPEARAADPADSGAMQRGIVARLCGRGSGPGEEAIGARSTPAERAGAAAFLLGAIEDLGLTPLRHDYRYPNVNGLVDLLIPPFRGTNVYTVVEATSAGAEYVIVGAHYDSVPGSPGAVDNAAGVALVLALAGELSRISTRDFNFVFVLFDQEEDDEVGSRAFVRYLSRESYRVHSVHILDVVAWDEDGDRAVEVQSSPDRFLERIYRDAAARVGIPISVIGGPGASDNRSFDEAGLRTVGVWSDDMTPHVHTAADTFDTVDFEILGSTTELVLEVLTHLGRAERSGER